MDNVRRFNMVRTISIAGCDVERYLPPEPRDVLDNGVQPIDDNTGRKRKRKPRKTGEVKSKPVKKKK